MELNRRRFVGMWITGLIAGLLKAWPIPCRRKFPGRVRPLDETRWMEEGPWLG